jgi:hypothetical protein
MKREEYLNAIEKAGFGNITVVDESIFPLDCVISDPIAAIITGDLNATRKQIEGISDSIASIKVQGFKPSIPK